MGSSNKKTEDKGTPAEVQMATIQPFMPGFDQAIANQLSQGFGGNPSGYLDAFSSIYQPMSVPTQFAPPTGGSGSDSGSNRGPTLIDVLRNTVNWR